MFREKIYCGLDIGSQRIKAGILKVKDSEHVELIGVIENPIQGFKDASVTDLSELTECIHHTINELSKKHGIKLRNIYLGVGGALIDHIETNTVIPLIDNGSKMISRKDVAHLNNQARLLHTKAEEKILHDVPQYYEIDDENIALNPQGLYGRKLNMQSLIIMTGANKVNNIVKAVHQAGYDVSHLFFNSYAASEISLIDEEKQQGCTLIDIGAKGTSILIFKDKILKFLDKINWGGDHITMKIAERLNLPFDLAEDIKKSYANALESDRHQEEEILVKRENSYIPIKREVIDQSIELEITAAVEDIQEKIENSGFNHELKAGIVMIGGGALLPGLVERIAQQTDIPVRLGKIHLMSQNISTHAALFSSVIGVAHQGYKKSFRYTVSSNGHTHWAERTVNRIKELYQEYF